VKDDVNKGGGRLEKYVLTLFRLALWVVDEGAALILKLRFLDWQLVQHRG